MLNTWLKKNADQELEKIQQFTILQVIYQNDLLHATWQALNKVVFKNPISFLLFWECFYL